jgi:hypothetical protein
MSDPRDDLADVIGQHYVWTDDETIGNNPEIDTYRGIADAILARWRLVPVEDIPEWSPAYAHETPVPCYEDDVSRCGCSTCINEPKVPGKRPITEAQRRERFLTPNVHPPKPKPDIAAQHRAADELTQHDQAAGHYRDDLAAGLYIPPRPRTDQHGPHED